MPIRIFHVIETLWGGMGGMEKGVANVIQRLDPERFQHAVCVIRSLGVLAQAFPADRVKLICLGQTDARFSFPVRRLVHEIRAAQPDIVHSRNWGAIEAVLAGKWTGSHALIHGEHGMESAEVYPLRRRMFRRLCFGMVDRVVTVSYNLRDLHARRTGYPAKRITVIHNGVDTDRFCHRASVRADARQALGIRREDFCIGTVARLEPVKDLVTLLRAAGELASCSGEQFKLFIAGDGSELPVLQESLRYFPQLSGRVQFLGEIQDTPNFLNALDVFVLSSLYEGISNSLLEAMATRLPVVATVTGGNPEVVVNGMSGLMFPVGDFRLLAAHLKSLAQDRDLRERLATQALARVRDHFSMNAMVRAYEQLYASLAPKAQS